MNPTQKIAEIYKQMLMDEAKKKMDPVGQADGDIDNDGDEDESDEYLHNRRKAIKKAMKNEKTECPKCKGEGCDHCDNKGYHEALEIDPDDGETKKVSGKEDEKKKKKKEGDTETSSDNGDMAEAKIAEVEEPRSPLDKKFKAMHKVATDDTEEKGHQDAVSAGRAGPSRKMRPGDNAQGDTKPVNKAKKLKELRK